MKENDKPKQSKQQEQEQPKCPNCGAPLNYDPEKGTLICSYCGTGVDLGEQKDNRISGFDFEDVESHAFQEDAEDIPVFNCVSCGAEILAAREEVSLTCPYCGNNIILTGKVSGKLRPDALIPFKIKPADLSNSLKRFYRDKKLLPKDFFSKSQLEKVTGVYVPFWAFSGELSGDLSYNAEIRSSYTTETEEVTTVRDYRLLRNVRVDFKDLLLDASEKMQDDYMDSIMPYDLSEAKDFDMGYLAGFAADRFDVKSKELSGRAEELMRTSAYNAVAQKAGAGYSNVRFVGGSLSADMSEVKYLLLPVYVFDLKYSGTPFRFAVNGQTGKAVGKFPKVKKTYKMFQQTRMAIAFAAVMAASVLIYFITGV